MFTVTLPGAAKKHFVTRNEALDFIESTTGPVVFTEDAASEFYTTLWMDGRLDNAATDAFHSVI